MPDDPAAARRRVVRLVAAGTALPMAAVAGIGAGLWLDGGTGGLWTALLGLAGLGIGLYHLIRATL
jgi:hypothetical protein